MNRTLTLNTDARCVLLEALLTSEEGQSAQIRETSEIRGARFERGKKRLQLLGFVAGDSNDLTPEGIKTARQVQEFEARLQAGIPFSERHTAIRKRGGRDTADVEDEWTEIEINSQPAFTNGYFIMYGVPPSPNRSCKHISPECAARVWYETVAANPRRVRPVAYTDKQAWKDRLRLIWFDDGAAISADIFNYITARFPGAIWTHNQERGYKGLLCSAFNIYYQGKRVAVACNYHLEPSETILAMIEAGSEKPQAAQSVNATEKACEQVSALERVVKPAQPAVQMSLYAEAA